MRPGPPLAIAASAPGSGPSRLSVHVAPPSREVQVIHDRWSDGTTPHEPIATSVPLLVSATSITSVYSSGSCVPSISACVQVAPSSLVQMRGLELVSPAKTPPDRDPLGRRGTRRR